ncbi:hypothetical protein [Streptacidiphilus monticola]|uniref:SnoaL-like domain-containing protein n=1 Tax=Streptacidiphilus monticola TaxID=2161674 RepID=A0ABW1GBG0_9ACTN
MATVEVGTTVTGSTAPDVQRRRLDAGLVLSAGRWRIGSLTAVPDDAAPQRNTDPAAAQVAAVIGPAVARILSYTPDDLDGTDQAARRLLGGGAAAQYQALFGRIRQQVAAQQLSLRTTVVRIGVGELTADRAELLVFVDQTAQRAGRAATTVGGQLAVVAQRRDGRWSITQLSER